MLPTVLVSVPYNKICYVAYRQLIADDITVSKCITYDWNFILEENKSEEITSGCSVPLVYRFKNINYEMQRF